MLSLEEIMKLVCYLLRKALILVFLLSIGGVVAYALPNGIIGRTLKNSSAGCGASGCHGSQSTSFTVTISGDAMIQPGQTKQYSVTVPSSLGTNWGGVNIAVSSGTLSAVSSNLRLDAGELAHNARQSLPATFTFNYRAPNSPGTTQTMYAVVKAGGASTNGGNWRHASNKSIQISTTSVETQSAEAPQHFALHQNYPNPFNPTTTIRYSIVNRARLSLAVVSLTGEVVAELVDGVREAGVYDVLWDGTDRHGKSLASGVYLYRLMVEPENGSERFVSTKKMLYLR
jgi:hypothetical protein